MENEFVPSDWYLKVLLIQRQLYKRLYNGPEPKTLTLAMQSELNEAVKVFIDKLMLRACALAGFRCQCKTRKEFEAKRIVLIADDIDQAWIVLNSELE
jgi:hypothetical protein